MYNTGYIYKIYCKDENVKHSYFGSTTNFNRRKVEHKSRCNNNKKTHNRLLYKFIRDNGGWDNWSMEIIETVKYYNKHKLLQREQIYINVNDLLCLNYNNNFYDAERERVWKAARYRSHKKVITCECGIAYVGHYKSHIKRHEASVGHQAYIDC